MSATLPPITGHGGYVVEPMRLQGDDTGIRVTPKGITVAYNGQALRARLTTAQFRDFARKARATADDADRAAGKLTGFDRDLQEWRRLDEKEAARLLGNAKRHKLEDFEPTDPADTRRRWELAERFLERHRGQLDQSTPLPATVADFLILKAGETLAGKGHARSRSRLADMCERTAVEFIALAERDVIKLTPAEARALVAELYQVHPARPGKWEDKHDPWGSLELAIKERPGIDRTEFCTRQLEINAALWREETANEEVRKFWGTKLSS